MKKRKKVLLIAESVSLAHVGRLLRLKETLDPDRYECTFAADPRYRFAMSSHNGAFRPIKTIPAEQFSRAIENGLPIYDFKSLKAYVEEELRLIDEIRPDLIVGDFRISLRISSLVAKIPYINVINATWCPQADLHPPVPDIKITRFLGVPISQFLFDASKGWMGRIFADAHNQTKKFFGVGKRLDDFRETYLEADLICLADLPQLARLKKRPKNCRFIGPVLFSLDAPVPSWWGALPKNVPVVYITPGTSGTDFLPEVLSAISKLPIAAIVGTAGRKIKSSLPENVFAAEYLPGALCTRRSSLVISNGGTGTTYQALAEGLPALGISYNLDQYLNMTLLEKAGVGILLRSGKLVVKKIKDSIEKLLFDPGYHERAEQIQKRIAAYDTRKLFSEAVSELV